MALFSIPIPSNLSYFASILMYITNFDFVVILDIKGTDDESVIYEEVSDDEEGFEAFNKNFEKMGYTSKNLLVNNSNLFFVFILIILGIIVIVVMKLICIQFSL